jgi:hypothetical protein
MLSAVSEAPGNQSNPPLLRNVVGGDAVILPSTYKTPVADACAVILQSASPMMHFPVT